MQEKIVGKQTSKMIYYLELLVVAVLLVAFLADIPILILAAFGLATLLILFSNREKSIYYLAFFTSFAGIFVYQGRHMFFVMAALFIIKFIFSDKIDRVTFIYYLVIVFYCLTFSDMDGDFSFARVIGIILLFVVPVIANYSNRINCVMLMQHYIFGFAIATIIGLFVTEIPAMLKLFEYDLMWTEDYIELTRFFGLAFDSNFYALSNYIVIAYLLFAFERINAFRIILVLFFVITGLQTISKSYIIILAVLVIYYFIKNAPNVKKLILSLAVFGIAVWIFAAISDKLDYNVLDLVLSRFIKGGSFADNTTGRVDTWIEYLNIFENANAKEIIFGFGFNASVKRAAHNTFIELFYHYGLVGFIIWISYFVHCWRLFNVNATEFKNRTPVVFICLIAGIFFLSAYTYEAFFMGMIIAFITLGRGSKERDSLGNV